MMTAHPQSVMLQGTCGSVGQVAQNTLGTKIDDRARP